MSRNILLVARREYLSHVRTRSFILGVLLTPVLIAFAVGLNHVMEKAARKAGKPFAIVDLSTPAPPPALPGLERPEAGHFEGTPPGSDLGRRLEKSWEGAARWRLEAVLRPGAAEAPALLDLLSRRTRDGELEGFAVLRGDLVAGDGKMQWYTRNVANVDLKKALANDLRELVRLDRTVWHGVSESTLAAIQAPVLDERDVDVSGRSTGDATSREAASFIPMIFVYALLIGISAQAQSLLTSTIEEKSNRLVEVLLSSISPWELMAGKIVGLVAATLTLMALWTVAGAYMVHRQGWEHLVRNEMFAWFLVYLVVTISFYSTFIAAIGSAVTELKEAQNLMLPVWICLMIPLFLMFFVGQHPDLWWVRVLTYVPFFTPFLMMNRLASAVPPGPVEIAASLVLMVFSCWGATYLAARVFRVGILLYGKPANPRELWRWMRAG